MQIKSIQIILIRDKAANKCNNENRAARADLIVKEFKSRRTAGSFPEIPGWSQ